MNTPTPPVVRALAAVPLALSLVLGACTAGGVAFHESAVDWELLGGDLAEGPPFRVRTILAADAETVAGKILLVEGTMVEIDAEGRLITLADARDPEARLTVTLADLDPTQRVDPELHGRTARTQGAYDVDTRTLRAQALAVRPPDIEWSED